MSVNIGASNQDDAFYRYKMPKLQARIEGRGNGIKTNVVNNVDIAKALDRPPEYILKYYGCELGALTTFDAKSGTSIVNGAHDTKMLIDKLEGFIKKYVQCYQCGNPETVFKIRKDTIKMKCKACGGDSIIDMSQERHARLNNYIIKHPPEPKVSKAEKKLAKAERERLKGLEDEKKEKKEKKSKEKKEGKVADKTNGADKEEPVADEPDEEVPEDDDEEDDDVEWMADTSEEAIRRRAQEQLTAATVAMVHAPVAEADDGANAAAAAKPAAAPAPAPAAAPAPAPAEEESSEEEEEDLVEELRDAANTLSAEKVALALSKIDIEGGPIGRMQLLYEALFAGPGKSLPERVAQHSELLKLHAGSAMEQLAQLLALEHLLVAVLPDRSKEVESVLKALYEHEIVAGEVMVGWNKKVGAGRSIGIKPEDGRALRASARHFFKWLASEAEESEESDEEE